MLIVGIGGTTRAGSSSEVALQIALGGARDAGAEILLLGADDLQLPLYDPAADVRSPRARALVDAVASADGLLLSSPGYHGTVSGLVKNAIDYVEDLSQAERPYLTDRPVGCIAVAYGWQAAVNTLQTLRTIVHSLRGWPTPYGAAVNALEAGLGGGTCEDANVAAGLRLVGAQVVELARTKSATVAVPEAR